MKKPQEVNQKFVLGEIIKIREELQRLTKATDELYGSLMYEEAKKYVVKYKSMTGEKLRKKFLIGYYTSSYIFDALVENGIVEGSMVGDMVVYFVRKNM
jgi:hypothetical protein